MAKRLALVPVFRGKARTDFQILAADLRRENEQLLEEGRQMRAALAVWAEVAVQTCLKCPHQATAGTACGNHGCRSDLVQVATSLLRSLDQNAA